MMPPSHLELRYAGTDNRGCARSGATVDIPAKLAEAKFKQGWKSTPNQGARRRGDRRHHLQHRQGRARLVGGELMNHLERAQILIEHASRRPRSDHEAGRADLAEAQVHATLHLADQVARVAQMLDYIDGKLPR